VAHENNLAKGGGDLRGPKERPGQAHSLDDALDALAAGGPEDLLHGVGAALGTDGNAPERRGQVELARVDVDYEDAGAAREFQPLGDQAANGAGAEDCSIVTGLNAH